MKTILSQFCEDFDGRVRPLLEPLDAFADDLAGVPADSPLAGLLPQVVDVRHQLRTLVEKVAEQQAYVIIFGPLKSGKSTLMNALAAAYVSEVTTLPAYPCMVYVTYAQRTAFTVTRYDGSEQWFEELENMRTLMAEAHGELAGAIREVERHGEDFEPVRHMPRALRRIDVRMPAEPLADSGAVLVDTPGLYSRMKFGYDLMTREFRDAAASAIFVVKTDNLFLEQVFDEFADLLRLFSRIFLIVNLDGTKQDLQPDGELGPSLERRDPQRIIEAFERLAMNADLRVAREEGRLRIYPIDLLQAAHHRLRVARGEADHSGTDAGGRDLEGAVPDGEAERAQTTFDAFTADLTHYLNSTEYLAAFLGDSLRQADFLVRGLRALCTSEPVHELNRSVERWDEEALQARERLEALGRLQAFPWEDSFARLREDVVRIAREQAGELRRAAAEASESALARWYDGDASFASLLQDDIEGVLAGSRAAVIERAREVSLTVLSSDVASALVRREANADLERVGLSVAAIARQLDGTVRTPAERHSVATRIPTRLIPVRRRLLDWLLLRGQAAVRRRVFGPEDAPTRPIARVVKQRRLGAGRVALSEAIRKRIDLFFAETSNRITGEVFGAHVALLCRHVRERLAVLRAENEERQSAAERQQARLRAVRERVEGLAAGVGDAGPAIEALAATYAEALPALAKERQTPGDAPASRAAAAGAGATGARRRHH